MQLNAIFKYNVVYLQHYIVINANLAVCSIGVVLHNERKILYYE
jgi:hypothetical protein